MAKRLLTSSAGLLALTSLLLAYAPASGAQTVTAVAKLDAKQLTGTWYEVARFPNKREKDCVDDAFILIAPGDKLHQIQLVTSCRTKNGYMDVRNAVARPAKKKIDDGRLKVTFTWPFSSKYWVLALGSSTEWALIGSPNHKNLWVYSKSIALKPEVLEPIKAIAAAQGFPVAKLVPTAQPGR